MTWCHTYVIFATEARRLVTLEQMCYDSGLAATRRDTSRGRTHFSDGPCVMPPVFGKLEVHMTTGTIKKVVSDRGFGFIAGEDAKEYFFHRGGLDGSLDFDRLVGGERVQFEIETSPKGPRATQVRSA